MPSINAISHAAIRSVQDPQARQLFQQLADMAAVRNGDLGNGDEAFLTLGDLYGNKTVAGRVARAIAQPIVDGINAPGSEMQQLADALQDRILASAAWQQLFAPIALLTAPDTTPGSVLYAMLQEGKARGAAVKQVSETIKTANENIAKVSQQLVVGLAQSAAAISSEAQARATADSAMAGRIDTLVAQTNGNTAGIQSEQSARTNSDNALVSAINTLWGQVGNNNALVSGGSNVVLNSTGGAVTKWDQLQATVNDPTTGLVKKYAALRTDLALTNDTVKGMAAKWSVKLDLNGYISGLSLNAGTTPEGKSESAFLILADTFAVGAPGKPNIVPFAIDATTGLVAIRGDLVVKNSITAAQMALNSIGRDQLALRAVGGAQIDDLAVDTLQIRGNAVTVPKVVTRTDYFTPNWNWQDIIGGWIYLQQPGTIMAIATVSQTSSGHDTTWQMQLVVDGIEISSCGGDSPLDSAAISGAITVGAGYHYIAINRRGESGQRAYNRTLTIFGVMR